MASINQFKRQRVINAAYCQKLHCQVESILFKTINRIFLHMVAPVGETRLKFVAAPTLRNELAGIICNL